MESGLPSFPPDYTCPVVLRIPLRVRSAFDYRALTFYGPAFQQVHLAVGLVTLLMRSYNPQSASTWVWAVPISLAATFGISVIYFPPGTEMVHFPGLAHTHLCIQRAVTGVHPVGFPHSEILGSKPACGSPRLIAASHVLHRLLAPRHSPYALSSLIIKLTQSVFRFCSRRALAWQFQSLSTSRFLRFHISSHPIFSLPGHGPRTSLFNSFESFRYRLQAFDIAVFKQLNKPPFLPQYCSILEQTCK